MTTIAGDLFCVCEPECTASVCEREWYESCVPSMERAAIVLLPPEKDNDEQRQSRMATTITNGGTRWVSLSDRMGTQVCNVNVRLR